MTKGERIKQRRKDLGLSQVDVADEMGVSKQLYYKYENDIVTNIPSDKIEALSRILQVSPAFIMGWVDDALCSAKEADDAAVVSLRLQKDQAMVKALKEYFKMPPDMRRRVVEMIHLLADK